MDTDSYQYDYNAIPPLAMLEKVPLNQWGSLKWWSKVIYQVIRILLNTLAADESQSLSEPLKELDNITTDAPLAIRALEIATETLSKHEDLSEIIKEFKTLKEEINNETWTSERFQNLLLLIEKKLSAHSTFVSANDLEAYNNQFRVIPLPAVSQNFKEDLQFANMRVAGPNPLVIERMTVADPRFPVSEEQYQEVMGASDSLESAYAEGRIYLADYSLFENALQGSYPQAQKYLCAPLALFAVPKASAKSRYLHPIAIQCFAQPSPDNPIFTPKDGDNWLIAKTIVQIADGNFHEAISHLGRTHLFVEPFAIATYRTLPEDNPLRMLLVPHFEGTFLINWGAQTLLIVPKGGVDELLAPAIDAARVVATQGAQSYLFNFNTSMLPETLARRGVSDREKLPYYPYRDDALEIWNAIQNWAKAYLTIYYKNDEGVRNDSDLQNWVAELLSHEGGRLKNIGEDGKIQTLDYLIKATTMIIFTASAQHAAVNFPQSKIMSYTPAMPLAGYSPAPTSTKTEQSYLDLLPSLDTAQSQLNLTYLLGSVYYTQLGNYTDSEFTQNKEVEKALENFQNTLKEIEKKIEVRNRQNPDFPYEYLLPSQIPQSINI
ncbi:MAG: lipoxygenase family protein [Spirulina sp.]